MPAVTSRGVRVKQAYWFEGLTTSRPPSPSSMAIVLPVTPAAAPLPDPDHTPFADASPAQVRAALTAYDAAEFDRQWQAVMARANEELDLTEVLQTLAAWRRVALVTTSVGAEQYTAALTSAEHRLRTGERHPGTVPWSRLRAELGLPE